MLGESKSSTRDWLVLSVPPSSKFSPPAIRPFLLHSSWAQFIVGKKGTLPSYPLLRALEHDLPCEVAGADEDF
jgi:hypothetical protein